MKQIIILFCLLFAGFNALKAQYPKEFPADNAGYGKSYSEFLKANCSRDDCKKVAELFPKAITTGKAATYFLKIKGITQSMLLKKAPAYPAFMSLASMLLTLDETKANPNSIDKNFDILQALIDRAKSGNIKEFTGYLDYLTNLYSKNSLYYTNTNTWQTTGDYTVEFKDDKPLFSFASTDLIGTSNADTLVIKNEKGVFYPLENVWIGKNGTISMQRSGFDPANNYVNFGNHQINFTKSDITIDSAKLTFKPVLNEVQIDALYR